MKYLGIFLIVLLGMSAADTTDDVMNFLDGLFKGLNLDKQIGDYQQCYESASTMVKEFKEGVEAGSGMFKDMEKCIDKITLALGRFYDIEQSCFGTGANIFLEAKLFVKQFHSFGDYMLEVLDEATNNIGTIIRQVKTIYTSFEKKDYKSAALYIGNNVMLLFNVTAPLRPPGTAFPISEAAVTSQAHGHKYGYSAADVIEEVIESLYQFAFRMRIFPVDLAVQACSDPIFELKNDTLQAVNDLFGEAKIQQGVEDFLKALRELNPIYKKCPDFFKVIEKNANTMVLNFKNIKDIGKRIMAHIPEVISLVTDALMEGKVFHWQKLAGDLGEVFAILFVYETSSRLGYTVSQTYFS